MGPPSLLGGHLKIEYGGGVIQKLNNFEINIFYGISINPSAEERIERVKPSFAKT